VGLLQAYYHHKTSRPVTVHQNCSTSANFYRPAELIQSKKTCFRLRWLDRDQQNRCRPANLLADMLEMQTRSGTSKLIATEGSFKMQTFRLADLLETSRLAPDWQAHSRPAGCDRHTDRPTPDQQPMHAHWVFTRKSSSCKQLNLPVLITFTAAVEEVFIIHWYICMTSYTDSTWQISILCTCMQINICISVYQSTYQYVHADLHTGMCIQSCILVCACTSEGSDAEGAWAHISLSSTVSQALEQGWNETWQMTEQGCTGTRLELNKARLL